MASFLSVHHMTYRTILEELLGRKEAAFENLLRIEDTLSKTMSLEAIASHPEHIAAMEEWASSISAYKKLKEIIDGLDYDPYGHTALSDI